MTSPLIVPIADALEAAWNAPIPVGETRSFLDDVTTAADACIAVIAALPADYTAVDVLAFLRGEDVPSEPLAVKGYDCCEHCGDAAPIHQVHGHATPCTGPHGRDGAA